MPKRAVPTFLLLLLLPLFTACGGDSIESISADLRAKTAELADVYAKIDSVESAEAEAKKLREISDEMAALGDALRALAGDDPEQQMAAQAALMEVSNGPEQARLTAESKRLFASPEIGAALQRSMEQKR